MECATRNATQSSGVARAVDAEQQGEASAEIRERAHHARQRQIQRIISNVRSEVEVQTAEMRIEALEKLFRRADSDGNGLLTMQEYASSGSPLRFGEVQGPFRQAME